jgi:hypothetical protein
MARRDLTVRLAAEIRGFPRGDADSRNAGDTEGQLWPRIRAFVDARAGSVDESCWLGAKRVSPLLYDYPVNLHGKNSPVAMTTGAPRMRGRSVTHHRALEGS